MTSSKNATTTYTKLKSGAWGIRSEDDTLVSGDFVEVTKKSGEKPIEEVGKVISKGDGWIVAEIVPSKAAKASAPRNYRKASWKCKASGCSASANDRGYCRLCAFDEFDN